MRQLLLFYMLCLLPLLSWGQEYCDHWGFGTECITLGDNGRYSYFSTHCTGGEKGEGEYKFRNKYLYLYFQTDSARIKNRIEPQITITETDTDSIEVNVTFLDEDGTEPMLGGRVLVRDSIKGIISGCITDENGECTIPMPKTDKVYEVLVEYLGTKDVKIPIQTNKNYNVVVIANEEPFTTYYGTGDTLIYRARRRRVGHMALSRVWEDGTKSKPVIYYKK